MENWLPRHRITVDEYYRMAQVGLLTEDARVELIEGENIDMAPIGSRHAAVVNDPARLFNFAVHGNALVSIQAPVRLSRASEPQPDLAILRMQADKYRGGHPSASDVLLIVEVSETTLRYDREIKVPLYARHVVPELWLVDSPGEQIHFFRSPVGEQYADVSSSQEPGLTAIVALPRTAVHLTDVLKI